MNDLGIEKCFNCGKICDPAKGKVDEFDDWYCFGCIKIKSMTQEELLTAIKKDEEKAKKKRIADKKRLAKKGFKWIINCWIHPGNGGDDYEMVLYSPTKLTDKQIQTEIKKAGSSVLHDYRQEKLSKEFGK